MGNQILMRRGRPNLKLLAILATLVAGGCGSFSKPSAVDGSSVGTGGSDGSVSSDAQKPAGGGGAAGAAGLGGAVVGDGGLGTAGGTSGSSGSSGSGGGTVPISSTGGADGGGLDSVPGGIIPDAAQPDTASPPSCTSACALGKTRCGAAGIQTCVMLMNGCAGWDADVVCPAPQTCPAGGTGCECPAANACPQENKIQCGPGGGTEKCTKTGACLVWGSEAACTVTNGNATCTAGQCGVVSCQSGFNLCGKRCAADTDVTACGSGCKTCPAVANASPTCSGGDCDFKCNDKFMRCAKLPACERTVWGFESNTLEGFDEGDSTGGNVVAKLVKGSAHGGQYSYSLAITPDAFGIAGAAFSHRKVCGGIPAGGANVQGKTLEAWIYLDSNSAYLDGTACDLSIFYDMTSENGAGMVLNPPARTWFRITATIKSDGSTHMGGFGVSCKFTIPDKSWTGTMLVDDVRIQ
jgi:hypothetical protein